MQAKTEKATTARSLMTLAVLLAGTALVAFPANAQGVKKDLKPVTSEMLANPPAEDWLMLNRTYDEQRYSPLEQINKDNASQLRMAWSRGLTSGTIESTPLVVQGVMYVLSPGQGVLAVDAKNGDTLWEYVREISKEVTAVVGAPTRARQKGIAFYEDMVFYQGIDGVLVALDAKTGKVRWETTEHDYKDKTQSTSAPIVADGKVVTGRTCEKRAGCFIAAYDAKTGKEVWKFFTTAGPDEPGDDSWHGAPEDVRVASTWGLPGSYDPQRKVVYWGIANAKPYTRMRRHGTADGTGQEAPADLYGDSTVALNVETGKLQWYYQHLPGDDWDLDHTHERTLVRTKINPDPAAVKWINPNVKAGEEHDVVVAVGEAGGFWLLNRDDGKFLWAFPFPRDVPNFHLSKIDVDTGRTHINFDQVMKKDGDKILVCFHNTRSWWSTAYSPKTNSLYIPYHENCLSMTANEKSKDGWGPRRAVLSPGWDPEKYANIAKVNLETGKMEVIYTQPLPGNGAALVTGGNVLFWGDMNRRFRAFDAENGKVLWETVVGGMVMASTITYAVDGKQYVAILTGDGQSGTAGPLAQVRDKMKAVRGSNAIYVFALP